jgi:hypothetical protein
LQDRVIALCYNLTVNQIATQIKDS